MGGKHEVASALADPWLIVVLTAAGIVTAVLVGLALATVTRRQSRSYFLIALALVALFARTIVAVASMTGVFGDATHHLLEHGLDVTMAALVIGAVYYARSITRGGTTEGISHE
ncbi:DUF7471 family protein [Halorussus sp. AFM4]|uniref:DUF7471 family protein n=1 Tax=Halorussus sp. AFM4 TaxID=3421651 RepID=UPI003EB80C25